MAYAAESDLVAKYGEQEIADISDKSGAGSLDSVVVAAALTDADHEINGYLASRYTVPLLVVPTLIKRIACDITRYRLYDNRPQDEVRQRFDDAIRWLRRVADGEVILLADDGTSLEPKTASIPNTAASSARVLKYDGDTFKSRYGYGDDPL
jgi:phage gp36-like protein